MFFLSAPDNLLSVYDRINVIFLMTSAINPFMIEITINKSFYADKYKNDAEIERQSKREVIIAESSFKALILVQKHEIEHSKVNQDTRDN